MIYRGSALAAGSMLSNATIRVPVNRSESASASALVATPYVRVHTYLHTYKRCTLTEEMRHGESEQARLQADWPISRLCRQTGCESGQASATQQGAALALDFWLGSLLSLRTGRTFNNKL